MADDNLDLDVGGGEGGGEAAAGGKKKGGGGKLAGLFSGMLKWILIGVGGVILIVVIVFVAITLVRKNSTPAAAVPISEEYTARREVLDWYTSLATIRTRSADTVPASIVVDLALGYKQGDNAASTEITSRLVELNDFLRRYFAQKTYAELQPQYEENLKIEIRNAINDQILSSSKIRDIAFKQLDVVQQI